jgi:nucleotide-binding universal stress UspA family protein
MASVRRILMPIDFSGPSMEALRYGADLAEQFGAELLLEHVIAPPAYPTSLFATIQAFPVLHHEVRQHAEDRLAEAQASLGSGVAARTIVREGVPHDEILAAAAEADCDLIVMATHGHTGFQHALLGSTAERVVRLSPVPVLTLRAPKP